jgi:Xaa-Pro aminopeptidase
MWALYNWYCSDFTRTIRVWNPSPTLPLSREGENKTSPLTRWEWGGFEEFQKIYNSVKKAHEKAFKFAKPWVTGKDIDNIARKSIEQDGYWEYFTHSTGHGVGLNIHEQPWISKKSENIIQKGMVFTIEPGIYLPWKFWVRLENIVFAEEGGVKCESEVEL